MQRLVRRVRYLLRPNRADADLAEEMDFHRAMLREAGGLDSGAARRAMGNTSISREDARAVWIWPWLETVFQDLGYAARGFLRQPGFTAVAVLALGCAIGLNTSLFTVFNALALRPWPVPQPSRVVRVYGRVNKVARGFDDVTGMSYPQYRYLAEHAKSMSGLYLKAADLSLATDFGRVRAEFVTANYFRVLGVGMQAGRGFLDEEDRTESPRAVVVLSYHAWQNRFGGDPAVMGRTVRLEQIPFTVVGIAPEDFTGTNPDLTDLWIPIGSSRLLFPDQAWTRDLIHDPQPCCDVAGRLSPGVSRAQATAELTLLSADCARQLKMESDGVVLAGTPPLQKPGRKTWQLTAVFVLIFAAVTLVLLLACANVGNLLLARAGARRKEIAVRLSLGAGRRRIVRQLLTESLALAGTAGALGVGIAFVLPGPLFTQAVGELSISLLPDTTVLLYTLVISVVSCVAFGLAPALHATRGQFHGALTQRAGAGSRISLRGVLLAVQVAISVVLLVGAGLLVRAIRHARAQDPGFVVEGVAAAELEFPSSAYLAGRKQSFYQNLAQGLSGVPFGFSDLEPLDGTHNYTAIRPPGYRTGPEPRVLSSTVSAAYFDVLRIPIVAGRNFQPTDRGAPVVLVNQAFAERYFPGESAVGKTIGLDRPRQIVGVARDAHTWTLDAVEPALYFPVMSGTASMVLRDTAADRAVMEGVVKRLDPRVQVHFTPLSRNLDKWLNLSRVGATIAGLLGLLALALASIGVCGVFGYAVQQRTQEIGIRMALGAHSAQVMRVVFAWAARSLLVGLAVGFAGSLAASRLMQRYLMGMSPLDPESYGAAFLVLSLAGLVATYLPTRRAVKLDPVQALRQE